MPLIYSAPAASEVIVTPMIDLTWARIRHCHQLRGQFVVVAGRSGAGKTTAITYIADQLAADCDADVPHAFRSTYFVATDLLNTHPRTLERQLLAEFLSLGLDLHVGSDTRRLRPEVMMQTIIVALRQRNMQMVFIDEAGLIPAQGLNVLANLLNVAATMYRWRLTIVLAGMNELPVTVGRLPQVERRVVDTIWFEHYGAEEAVEVLSKLHPFFATVDLGAADGQEVVEFLLSPEVSDGGLLGRMIQIVERTALHCREQGRAFSMRELRTVHLLEAMDRERSLAEARRGYRGAHAPSEEYVQTGTDSNGGAKAASRRSRSWKRR